MKIDYTDYEETLIEFRRQLHSIPEIGFDLPNTTSFVRNILDEYDIEYSNLLDSSAIIAKIEGQNKVGKVIGLRADMDALPIKEETGLEFAATNGFMHACGHDAHTAILLVTGIILSKNKDKFDGTVKLIFQPAEESDGGAKPLIEAGVLDNPRVDYVLGQHVISAPGFVKSGIIHFTKGPMLASNDKFEIKYIGKGGHGAQPHTSVDPITMAAHCITSYQTMVAREIDPLEDVVFTIGSIHGGNSENTLPDSVKITGIIRTFNEDIREYLKKRIFEITEGICKSLKGQGQVIIEEGYPSVYNNESLTEIVSEHSIKVFGQDYIDTKTTKLMGAEDFAYYGLSVPSLFTFIDMPKKNVDGKIYPSHSSKFDLDENQMIKGVIYFVENALMLLNKQ